ncbi:hypothetical protein ACQUY5_16585 [Bacillus cereus]|uniref:hypothetical protein n=1 Tax=Bacillus cereus TaxID=1396 RepID=UPI003D17F4C0
MNIQLKYELKGFQLKLTNGVISDLSDVIFHGNDEKTLNEFFNYIGVELEGLHDANVMGKEVVIEASTDKVVSYIPFTNVDEVPKGLKQVVTYVRDHSLYGYVEVHGRDIIVHHYSQDLGENKLEELSKELIHEDLTGNVFFHI